MKFSQEFLKESLSPGAQKKKEITDKKMAKEVKFFRHGNVAHIGTGFGGVRHAELAEELEDILDTTVYGDENKEEKDLKIKFKKGKRFEKKTGGIYPKFLSKTRNYIANMPTAWVQSKKNVKAVLEKKVREENLKTMSESKKERKIRGKIREILHDPKNYVEPSDKLNPLDVMAEE